MTIIGLTGGIATGKSTVAALIRRMGYRVIDADHVAREVVAPGSPVLDQLAVAFGREVITQEGELDRRLLGEKVFKDPALLSKLNRITHPAILARIQQALAALEREGEKMVFLEVPLLYETGMDKLCDAVIVVTAHPEAQLDRLRERTGLSEAECKARIASQWPQAKKTALAEHSLDNSGHILQTESALKEILSRLRTV